MSVIQITLNFHLPCLFSAFSDLFNKIQADTKETKYFHDWTLVYDLEETVSLSDSKKRVVYQG